MEPGQAASKRSLKSGRQRMVPRESHSRGMITPEHRNVWPGPNAESSPNCPREISRAGPVICVPCGFYSHFTRRGCAPPGGRRAKVLTGKGIKKQKIGYRLEGLGQFCKDEGVFCRPGVLDGGRGRLGAAEAGRYARQEARATSGTLPRGEEPFLDFGADRDRSGTEAR